MTKLDATLHTSEGSSVGIWGTRERIIEIACEIIEGDSTLEVGGDYPLEIDGEWNRICVSAPTSLRVLGTGHPRDWRTSENWAWVE